LTRAKDIVRRLLAPLGFIPEVILLGVVIYLGVRFTVRDLYVATRYVFYLPTAPVAAVCAVALMMRLVQRRRKWVAAISGIALAAIAYCVLTDEFHFARPHANPGDTAKALTVVTWNIQGGRSDWDAVSERIRREDPDIVMLAEAHVWKSHWGMRVWLKEFPGYHVAQIIGPLTILTKGKILSHEYVDVNRARFLRAALEINGKPLNIIVFHPRPHIRGDREAIYRTLAEFIDEFGDDTPLILSGDFNTPPNSAYLDPVEKRMSNAFHVAGSGFYYSWPSYLPLLAIDHTFVNSRVKVMDYRILPTDLSDHCMQKMTIILNPESTNET
jgi:endonuclease/exonuclease/phosphatase (EEP) superfamily protein YafD